MPKNQIKILYLVTLSEWGGAQKYIFDLANFFAQQKNYNVIVTSGGEQNGELIKRSVKLNIQTYYLRNLQRAVNFYQDWQVFWDILKLCKQLKPDIIHLNSSKSGAVGALAAKLAGVKKIIYTVHGLILNEPLSPTKKLFYKLAEKISAKFKTHFICVSEFDKKSLLKHKITQSEKISIIHNGIDLENLKFFDKLQAREKLNQIIDYKLKAKSYKLIGTIANFYPTKGLAYLIEAAKDAVKIKPELKFILIGQGLLRKKLEKLINNYKLQNNLFLTGQIPQAAQYLKAFDIFVLPSVKEGLAYTLIEAQAAGLPIITTRVGGNPEIIQHNKNGILVPAKDFAALTKNMLDLIHDKNKQELLSQKAIENVKQFDLKKMIEKTQKIYQK